MIADETGVRCLLGCTGETIVAGGREVESGPAIALWSAKLPGVTLEPMNLVFEETAEGAAFRGWPDNLPDPWPTGSVLILLADPFSFPVDRLLDRLNEDQPGIPVVGGMASGGNTPGSLRLISGRQVMSQGAVALLVHGDVHVESVVSQGCRPIGQPYVVTKVRDNIILELGGKPAFEQLQSLFQNSSAEDKMLMQQGLHLGRVVNEYKGDFGRGDFLVRNVLGADPKIGAIAIGDYVRAGQTVQFHARDARTADEDLREMLAKVPHGEGNEPAGALLFSCNGRGTRLFDQPDHDIGVLRQALGDIPIAGFFAQGEIGPIGGANALHGFTASVLVFRG